MKAAQKRDPDFYNARYNESEEMQQFGVFEECDANMLAEQFPAFYSFYPTEAVMLKLIRRIVERSARFKTEMILTTSSIWVNSIEMLLLSHALGR